MTKLVRRTYLAFNADMIPERYINYYDYIVTYVGDIYDDGTVGVYWSKNDDDQTDFDVFPFRVPMECVYVEEDYYKFIIAKTGDEERYNRIVDQLTLPAKMKD
jgi:hypothetical protein